MIQSMSRKANCWDCAPMESCFGTLKTELVHQACLGRSCFETDRRLPAPGIAPSRGRHLHGRNHLRYNHHERGRARHPRALDRRTACPRGSGPDSVFSPTGSRPSAPSRGWDAGMARRASMNPVADNARGMILIAEGPRRCAALRFSTRGKAGLRPRERPADILQVDVRVAKLA